MTRENRSKRELWLMQPSSSWNALIAEEQRTDNLCLSIHLLPITPLARYVASVQGVFKLI